MKIQADKNPKDSKEFTIADIKRFLEKLKLLDVPENARVTARVTVGKTYVYEMAVDDADLKTAITE